jgi:hypothetical protein
VGLNLNMGLGSSVFTSGYPGAGTPEAAGASPQGPTTIGQKAFGVVTGGAMPNKCAHIALLSAGTLSILGLVFIYYSPPR